MDPQSWRPAALDLRAEGVAEPADVAVRLGVEASEVAALFAAEPGAEEYVRGHRADVGHYSRLALKAETGEKPDVKTALKARLEVTRLRRELRAAQGAHDPSSARRLVAAAQEPKALKGAAR